MRFIVLASKACNFHLPSSYSLLPLCYWLPAPNAKCHWLWLPHTLTLTVAFQQLQFLLFQWSLPHARSESLRRANFLSFVVCNYCWKFLLLYKYRIAGTTFTYIFLLLWVQLLPCSAYRSCYNVAKSLIKFPCTICAACTQKHALTHIYKYLYVPYVHSHSK